MAFLFPLRLGCNARRMPKSRHLLQPDLPTVSSDSMPRTIRHLGVGLGHHQPGMLVQQGEGLLPFLMISFLERQHHSRLGGVLGTARLAVSRLLPTLDLFH